MNIYSILRRLRRLGNQARGEGRKVLNTILPQRQDSLRLATMGEWWDLTSEFKEFRRPSDTVLKEFGYMAIMREIGRMSGSSRILEFGHGFNTTLFTQFEKTHEMWGADDYLPLPYNLPKEEWEREYDAIRQACPRSRLVRGLLGNEDVTELPSGHFDVVCSVSVLEELRMRDLHRVLQHAHALLKPGGLFINTHDWRARNTKRYERYVKAHRRAGFDLDGASERPPETDMNELLLENPTVAMCWYQGTEGDHRLYRGHWTTILSMARKPAGSRS